MNQVPNRSHADGYLQATHARLRDPGDSWQCRTVQVKNLSAPVKIDLSESAVESLNGVRNRSTAGGAVREADPDFIRALDLLREVQTAGAFGMRVEEDKVKGSTGVVFFRRDDVPPNIQQKQTVRTKMGGWPVISHQSSVISHQQTVTSGDMISVPSVTSCSNPAKAQL